MESTQYLLIGGGLASSQAAKELRRQDPAAAITLVGDESHVPYDRPPLSKDFLRGEKSRDQLFFDSPETLREQRISLVLGIPVQRLDPGRRVATLGDGGTIQFQKCLLATGGRPLRLSIPGSDLPEIHYLRTLDDATAIATRAQRGRKALIIGAGFIGLEVAASLTQLGVHTTVIEAQEHIWPRFVDRSLAERVQKHCEHRGVVFRTGDTAVEFVRDRKGLAARLKSGAAIACDFACVGVGIVPNVTLAQQAGLTIQNGILVNEFLQTSVPDIYAGGDVANYFDPLFAKQRRVEHWGHAEYCGQLAAQNMAGARRPYDLLTYVWSDIFDLHLEFAGDESEHDEVLIRSVNEQSFFVFYLKQHILRAYFAINGAAKDFPLLQRVIRAKRDLRGTEAQLKDPAVSLKSLLA